jgi:hypothetical protein
MPPNRRRISGQNYGTSPQHLCVSSLSHLTSGCCFLRPPSVIPIDRPRKQHARTNRHFPQTHQTHRPRDPSTHLISTRQPAPVLTKITAYYQILPMPWPALPPILPSFRSARIKRPGSRVAQVPTSNHPRTQSTSPKQKPMGHSSQALRFSTGGVGWDGTMGRGEDVDVCV